MACDDVEFDVQIDFLPSEKKSGDWEIINFSDWPTKREKLKLPLLDLDAVNAFDNMAIGDVLIRLLNNVLLDLNLVHTFSKYRNLSPL